MRRNLKSLILGIGAMLLIKNASLAQIVILHDLTTGIINGTTTPIAYGSQDDTWTFPGFGASTSNKPIVCSNLSGAWDVNGCGRWISNKITATNDPYPNLSGGVYTYKTTFNLGGTCFKWVKATFTYIGGDNNITGFKINGHSYTLNPSTTNDYNPLTQNYSFNIAVSDLIVGTNAILIYVNNSESYQGLFVCGNISAEYCLK